MYGSKLHRECRTCHQSFETYNMQRDFCSSRCRQQAYRHRIEEQRRAAWKKLHGRKRA